MRELAIPGTMEYPGIEASASEDFAVIAEKVPSTFMYIAAGFTDGRPVYTSQHCLYEVFPAAQLPEE